MANALKSVAVTELTGSDATIYTVPANKRSTVTKMLLSNCTNGAVTVRVCVVPTSGSAVQANAILWDRSIPANSHIELAKGMILEDSDEIHAWAGAATSVNIQLSLIESDY